MYKKENSKLRYFNMFRDYPVIELKPKNTRGEYLYFAINPFVFQYRTYLGNGLSEEASKSFVEIYKQINLPKEEAPRGTGVLKKQMDLFKLEYPEIWSKLMEELKVYEENQIKYSNIRKNIKI